MRSTLAIFFPSTECKTNIVNTNEVYFGDFLPPTECKIDIVNSYDVNYTNMPMQYVAIIKGCRNDNF